MQGRPRAAWALVPRAAPTFGRQGLLRAIAATAAERRLPYITAGTFVFSR